MASDKNFVDFILDQIDVVGVVTAKKMFGDYGVFVDGKIVALICDNRLFIKPTPGGRSFIGDVVEAPAYPGAKSSFLIEDKFEDRDWLSQLINITVNELPAPKIKNKKVSPN